MAARIKAINFFRPKLQRGPTVQMKELAAFIAQRTGVHESEILLVLLELRDALLHFFLTGRGVKLLGLGTFLPNIKPDGTLDVEHRQDREFKQDLNHSPFFSGTILNKENIGKPMKYLVNLWNEMSPWDPVE